MVMDPSYPSRNGSASSVPSVSVIMPAYNVERYISEAIESILHQSFSDFEFIIVDDHSSDRTLDVVKSFARRDARIRYLSNARNMRRAAASNVGIALARGVFVAVMDADDIAMPERLEKQVRFLDAHAEVGAVGGAMVLMTPDGRVTGERRYRISDAAIRKGIFKYNPFCHPSVMMRRSLVLEAGLYDPHYATAEDYDLYFRLGKVAKFANLAEVLLRYRVRENGSLMSNLRATEVASLRIRKKYFVEYGATLSDRIYCAVHQMSLYILPARCRWWLFLKLRKFVV